MKFPLFSVVEFVETRAHFVITGTPEKILLAASGQPAYAYRAKHDASAAIWIRAQAEMEDGRFVLVQGEPS